MSVLVCRVGKQLKNMKKECTYKLCWQSYVTLGGAKGEPIAQGASKRTAGLATAKSKKETTYLGELFPFRDMDLEKSFISSVCGNCVPGGIAHASTVLGVLAVSLLFTMYGPGLEMGRCDADRATCWIVWEWWSRAAMGIIVEG
jgi:hypothetical protein